MNINPAAAASVAGTSRAAARGGEADNQASEATKRQSTAEQPAGKAVDSSEVDAGDQTGDRGGNGRQVLDVFDHEENEPESDDSAATERPPNNASDEDGHIDFTA